MKSDTPSITPDTPPVTPDIPKSKLVFGVYSGSIGKLKEQIRSALEARGIPCATYSFAGSGGAFFDVHVPQERRDQAIEATKPVIEGKAYLDE